MDNKIYKVDKIFVTFKLMGENNQTLISGNATAFIDVYSGFVLKWVINNTSPESINHKEFNSIKLIINSTNIPMNPNSSSLNIVTIIEVSILIIVILIPIVMVYIKNKRRPPRNYKYYNENKEKTIENSIVKTDPNTPASNLTSPFSITTLFC
jgi:short subunit fatty acids transporter